MSPGSCHRANVTKLTQARHQAFTKTRFSIRIDNHKRRETMSDIFETDSSFKVWVKFDQFGAPQRASWGLNAPEDAVVQIETDDMTTASRTARGLKSVIRRRHSPCSALGMALSGEL
jgi:hypothetical protein